MIGMQSSAQKIVQPARFLIAGLLDLIYPPLCLICEQRLSNHEDQLCDTCMDGFVLLDKKHDQLSVPGKVYLQNTWALFDFDPKFQSLIHHLKYSRRRKPILTVLDHYQDEITSRLSESPYDWIVSIPLHPRKQRERGYNQVDGVSAWLGEKLHAKLGGHLVKRIKYTVSQTKLNAAERQDNVSNAFDITDDQALKGKRILLVDDVLTTGATANALAQVLTHAGAIQVDLLTLSTPA